MDFVRGEKNLALTLTEFRIRASVVQTLYRELIRDELLVHCMDTPKQFLEAVDGQNINLRYTFKEVGIEQTPFNVEAAGYRLWSLI